MHGRTAECCRNGSSAFRGSRVWPDRLGIVECARRLAATGVGDCRGGDRGLRIDWVLPGACHICPRERIESKLDALPALAGRFLPVLRTAYSDLLADSSSI